MIEKNYKIKNLINYSLIPRNEHKNHKIVEKFDILAPTVNIINNIYKDDYIYIKLIIINIIIHSLYI